eukprot:g6542.t1
MCNTGVLALLAILAVAGGAEVEVNASGGQKESRAQLAGDETDEQMAARTSVTTAEDLAQLAFNDEDGLAVAGFFVADEDGAVKNREEGSAYQVFRDSTIKNAKLPFGKSVDPELAKQFGAKTMDSMWMLKRNDKQSDVLEVRKCQFFDDLTIYVSDDPANIVGTWKKEVGFEEWGPERALKHMKGEYF